jgi:hypothetical protein
VTFFVKDAINGDIPVQIILKLHTDIPHVIEGFDIEPSKAAIYCDANGQLHGMVTKGWVECARTYSFPCWRKRGLRHQRTESSNTPLKDFSLISGLQARFREREYIPLRGDQVREDLIISTKLSRNRRTLHADTTNARTSMDGTPT